MQMMMKAAAAGCLLLLAACGGGTEQDRNETRSDEGLLDNRAERLLQEADNSVDAAVNRLEAEAAALQNGSGDNAAANSAETP